MGVEEAGETPSLTEEFTGETHRVLEHTHTTHSGQHQKGPICLWVVGEVTESPLRARQWHCSLLDPNIQCQVALPWQIPKALPLIT